MAMGADDPNLFRTAHLRQEQVEWLGCPVHIVRLRPAMNAAELDSLARVERMSDPDFGKQVEYGPPFLFVEAIEFQVKIR